MYALVMCSCSYGLSELGIQCIEKGVKWNDTVGVDMHTDLMMSVIAIVEAIYGQHFGVAFRAEYPIFYWKTDVDCGLLPTILCLEGVSSVLKVTVHLDILYMCIGILQLLLLKFGMLHNLC